MTIAPAVLAVDIDTLFADTATLAMGLLMGLEAGPGFCPRRMLQGRIVVDSLLAAIRPSVSSLSGFSRIKTTRGEILGIAVDDGIHLCPKGGEERKLVLTAAGELLVATASAAVIAERYFGGDRREIKRKLQNLFRGLAVVWHEETVRDPDSVLVNETYQHLLRLSLFLHQTNFWY